MIMSLKKSEACKTVAKALQFDSEGFHEAAYTKYLIGIEQLGQYMKDFSYLDLQSSPRLKKETLQVLSLMRDSTDRLIKLISKNDQTDSDSDTNQSISLESSISDSNDSLMSSWSHPTNISNQLSTVRTIRAELSPLEKARRDNGFIYKDFQSRCQLVKDSSKRASMYLELHRRLTENIMIARVKEAAVRQQQIEKEREILELAAKKLALNKNNLSHVSNNTKDWEKLLLYAQILQYEEIEEWPKKNRIRLKNEPNNECLISDILKNTLCVSSHPLSLWMCKCQLQLLERLQFIINENRHLENLLPSCRNNSSQKETSCTSQQNNSSFVNLTSSDTNNKTSRSNSISSVLPLNKMWLEGDVVTLFDPLASKKYNFWDSTSLELNSLEPSARDHLQIQLEDIIQVTSEAVDTLVYMLCATYEIECDEGQDICYHILENYFFTPIWSHLLRIFRMVNYECEKQLNEAMEKYYATAQEEFSLPTFFDLEACTLEITNRFNRVIILHNPLAKLQQLIDIAQTVCNPKNTSGKSLGADELIGIMCFMLIKSGIPQLASELEAIEQLIPHRYLMGEEGYALTTHRTALKYLASQQY